MLLILLIFGYLFCIGQCSSSIWKENNQNWFLQSFFQEETQVQLQQREKRKQKMSCISFQDTIQIYPEIKENMEPFKLVNILKAGGCRHFIEPVIFLIIDNEIYKYGKYKDHYRIIQLQKLLNRLKIKNPLPDILFTLHLQDEMMEYSIFPETRQICTKTPLITFNKNCSDKFQKSKFLMPDIYIFQDFYGTFLKDLLSNKDKIKWEDKIQKLFFRGRPSTHTSTPNFVLKQFNEKTTELDLIQSFPRGAFVILSVKYPDLIDARFTATNKFSEQIKRRVEGFNEDIYISQKNFFEALNYKYLLSADGYGTAWKRIPSILHSNSLLFKVESQKLQYFYDKMVPGIHYIQINKDLSNLFTKMNEINKNQEKAKKIIQNANKFAAQYLTPQKIDLFILETLDKYAKIQKLSLAYFEITKIKQGINVNQILINRYSSHLKLLQNFMVAQIFISIIFFLLKKVKKCLKRCQQSKISTDNTIQINELSSSQN